MLERTDRHFRYFLRLISRRVLLYTEMVTTGALLHSNPDRILQYDSIEHPVALQLGGSNPRELSKCSSIAESKGYDAVNLNIGCPSNKVQKGRFGACLMAEPDLVADCVQAMCSSVSIPVTVKTRIGIDHRDSYEELAAFVETVSMAGCNEFVIHARKALLQGLSPKENRTIPELKYEVVRRLKNDFPKLAIVLNGGVVSLDEVSAHLRDVDGVMIGREAYNNPYVLAQVDSRFYGDSNPIPSRTDILIRYIPYIQHQLESGVRLSILTRHLFGLFHAVPGARNWRRDLAELSRRTNCGADDLLKVLPSPHFSPE